MPSSTRQHASGAVYCRQRVSLSSSSYFSKEHEFVGLNGLFEILFSECSPQIELLIGPFT